MQSIMNRRLFLMGSLTAPLAAQAETVGTGMIGTGNRGSYLLQGVLAQPGARVVAVCDIKPDRLDKAASAAVRDKPATFRDYHDLLARRDVDAVYIATPCDMHVEMAIAALKAGKHVYCEKPAGITPESIGRLIKAVKASGRVFQIGQQMRSMVQLRRTIERVASGEFGRIVMVKAQRHASDDLDHDGPSADWFFNAKRSGDVIVEMSVHNLDACNWVIGSRPERAAGFGGALVWPNEPPGRTNMDGYTLSYEYANDVKMSFTQVFFHPSGLPGNGQYFYVYTTTGAVDLNDSKYYPRKKGASPVVLAEPVKEEPHAHIAAFYESIRTGKPPVAGIQEGATGALTAILGREAIYRKKLMTWGDLGVEL